LGVDDDSGRTGLVSQQIGGVSEAAQIVLFQDHVDLYSLYATNPVLAPSAIFGGDVQKWKPG
jgi:hypothetical protein